MSLRLTDYEVLTFDCYGTMIDWESGIWDALQPAIARNGRRDVTRQRALSAFAKHENRQELETPELHYPEILTRVHRAIAAEFDLETTEALDREFGASVAHWPAFRDSADALRELATRYKLVILSNVDRAGFAASNEKLGVHFDAVYTAQDIGAYKPSPRNFEYLLEHVREDLGIEKDGILHTAQSLFHDHAPAKSFGLANVWIDRQHLSEGGNWGATAKLEDRPETDFVFFSLAEMAKAARADTTLPGRS